MLSAYLYRIRKQALKKPIVLILGFIAVAFSVLMLFYPMLFEDEYVRNTALVIGGLNVLLIVIFDFMFYSGVSSGVVGFSNADVNFHLAGPFSERFNLIIAASGILKLCAVFLWVLCCQVAVLVQTFGVNTSDMFGIVISSVFVMSFGYALGCFFGSKFDQSESAKKKIIAGFIACNVLFVGAAFISLLNTYGSITALRNLGAKGIIAALGSTYAIKAFPVAGWVGLVYSGIILKDAMYIALGTILIIATLALIIVLFRKCEINYYETAILNAQKVADIVEARKAGVDSDSSKINQKVKVGKETLKSGWGASAFFHRHLLENKRASKVFFLNPLALLYRVIIFFYLLIMRGSLDEDRMMLVSGLIMMVILNTVVYGGGKTVLEFNRPYIFMIPEPGYKKIFSCLSASFVEMLFDSIICAAILVYFAKLDLVYGFIICGFMIIFDMLCQLMSIVQMRILRNLGRVLLMVVRYLLIYGVIIVCAVPAVVVGVIFSSIAAGLITAGVTGVVIIGILLLISRNVVDNVELA